MADDDAGYKPYRPGETIYVCGSPYTVLRIKPYDGPYRDWFDTELLVRSAEHGHTVTVLRKDGSC
jgi:hypothetical protein